MNEPGFSRYKTALVLIGALGTIYALELTGGLALADSMTNVIEASLASLLFILNLTLVNNQGGLLPATILWGALSAWKLLQVFYFR